MKVSYKSTKLKKLLTDFSSLKKKYGERTAKKIIKRIEELQGFESLAVMPSPARVHPCEPKNKAEFLVDINKHSHPLRMVIKAVCHYDLSDLSTINEIEIVKIIEIHS